MRPLAALLLCAALSPAFAAGPAETRDFFSADRSFRVSVDYYGTNGSGKAAVTVSGSLGKKLSSFKTDLPPFSVTVSGDGRRLFFFCGSWGQSVSLYLLEVYSSKGKKLASHRLRMNGPSGEGFSGDGRLYAVGASGEGKNTLMVLHTETGKAAWRKTFKERLFDLRLAGTGGRLLAVFEAGTRRRRAVLFGPGGDSEWSAVIKTGRDLLPRALDEEGFELWEAGTVYNEEDGYWHARLLKKRYYSITEDGVTPGEVRALNEELR